MYFPHSLILGDIMQRLVLTCLILLLILPGCGTTTRPGIAIGPRGPVLPESDQVGNRLNTLSLGLVGKGQRSGLRDKEDPSDPYELFVADYENSLLAAHALTIELEAVPEDQQSKLGQFRRIVIENSGAANRLARNLLNSGITYSALVCDRYFNVLANRNQDIGFYVEGAGLFGGLAASVLGLTGSPAKSIALTATGFTATIAGLEAYRHHPCPRRSTVDE